MKERNLNHTFGALASAALLLFLPACATQTTTDVASNNMADTEMERVLVNSGFRARVASNDGQRNHITRLPDQQFQQVAIGGNSYYLWADKRENRLYIGDQYAYRAYLGYLHNHNLRKQGVFVWEVRPADRANNKTVEVWHSGTPFPEWSNFRPNDQAVTTSQ
jgi:hypothetical protein